MLTGLSGYMVSKVALTKLIEFLAVENPDVAFIAYHPGIVDGNTFRASGATPEHMPMDTCESLSDDHDMSLMSMQHKFQLALRFGRRCRKRSF